MQTMGGSYHWLVGTRGNRGSRDGSSWIGAAPDLGGSTSLYKQSSFLGS
jgi:hypothetical protein